MVACSPKSWSIFDPCSHFDPKDAQFDDAVVSSAIVWFKKTKPPANHRVRFSFGGTQKNPAIVKWISNRVLAGAEKWTRFPKQGPQRKHQGYRLGDLFVIKRGIVTGANDFFIIDEAKARALKLPKRYLRPILPVSRYIATDEIKSDAGVPLLAGERLFLIDCHLLALPRQPFATSQILVTHSPE